MKKVRVSEILYRLFALIAGVFFVVAFLSYVSGLIDHPEEIPNIFFIWNRGWEEGYWDYTIWIIRALPFGIAFSLLVMFKKYIAGIIGLVISVLLFSKSIRFSSRELYPNEFEGSMNWVLVMAAITIISIVFTLLIVVRNKKKQG